MKSRSLIPVIVSSAVFLAVAGAAWGQSSKIVKIAVLTDAMVPWHNSTEGFRDGLKELGYVEGKNVVFEARASEGDATRVPGLMAELLRGKPDVLFCVSDACRKENGPVPMVFVQVSDPVSLGLVRSIARPGGNVTGISNIRTELTAKRLELFKEIVPSLRRVLVSYDPRQSEEVEAVEFARSAAQKLGVTLLERAITDPLDIEPGLDELQPGGQDGILTVQANTNLNIPGRSLEVAMTNDLPAMYFASFWAEFGGALASYGPDQYSHGKQAARIVQKILNGTPPAEIPIELPDRIEFTINLKTAKRLGLEIPQAILLRADRIFE